MGNNLQRIAKILRKKFTDAEKLMRRHLRAKQLDDFKSRRQEPIGKYVVYFVCYEKKIIVEFDGGLPCFFTLHHNHIQGISTRITTNGSVRLHYKICNLTTKPMIPTSISIGVIHPLLNNGTISGLGENKRMVIELIPILHSATVHLGAHPAGIDEFFRITR